MIAAPSYDAPAMADAALQEFDRDKNGTLEGAEIDSCPSLKSALTFFDRNNDHKISRDELEQRFKHYATAAVGAVVMVTCQVNWDGMPLTGAEVKFVPEKFMGPRFKTASAITDAEGLATPKIEGETRDGLPAGLYRIEIRQKQGGIAIPPRYNDATKLGREVFDDGRSGGSHFEFELSSN